MYLRNARLFADIILYGRNSAMGNISTVWKSPLYVIFGGQANSVLRVRVHNNRQRTWVNTHAIRELAESDLLSVFGLESSASICCLIKGKVVPVLN
jgi:hypothetical protein